MVKVKENLTHNVELMAKHWGCTTTNIYAQIKKPEYAKKLQIIKLGSMCKENNISEKELLLLKLNSICRESCVSNNILLEAIEFVKKRSQ